MKHQQNQPGKKVKGPILQGHSIPPHASLGQNTWIDILTQFSFQISVIWNEICAQSR